MSQNKDPRPDFGSVVKRPAYLAKTTPDPDPDPEQAKVGKETATPALTREQNIPVTPAKSVVKTGEGKNKVKKKNETYHLSEETIDLVKRYTYWHRGKNKSTTVEKILLNFFSKHKLKPIPPDAGEIE